MQVEYTEYILYSCCVVVLYYHTTLQLPYTYSTVRQRVQHSTAAVCSASFTAEHTVLYSTYTMCSTYTMYTVYCTMIPVPVQSTQLYSTVYCTVYHRESSTLCVLYREYCTYIQYDSTLLYARNDLASSTTKRDDFINTVLCTVNAYCRYSTVLYRTPWYTEYYDQQYRTLCCFLGKKSTMILQYVL